MGMKFKKGDKIRFKTPYGPTPGTREGIIKNVMVAAPRGFYPMGDPHYDVTVFNSWRGYDEQFCVTDSMIEEGK